MPDLTHQRHTMFTQQLGDELPALLETSLRQDISESSVKLILSTPPFIPVPHALNLRTISSPSLLAPNIIFRSGGLSHLPAPVLSTLRTTYNITTVYDLRSRGERERTASPDIEGIETIWIPSSADIARLSLPSGDKEAAKKVKDVFTDIKPEDFVEKNGEAAYVKMYGNVLDVHKDSYTAVFRRLMNLQAKGGVLFHCTAGKDRTGVLAALILALIGASREEIAQDYALTRIGVNNFRAKLLGALLEALGKNDETGLDEPGMEQMCGVRAQSILAVLDWMNEKWGEGEGGSYPGVDGYLKKELNFTTEEVEKVRSSLKPVEI